MQIKEVINMVQKFDFRLQKVLDMRVKEEDHSKMEFKKAMDEKLITEQKLNMLQDSFKKFNKFQGKEESIIEKKLKLSYLKCLNSSINSVNEELVRKNRNLENKREILKGKQVKRKTVEVLKDKQYSTFVKEQNLLEQRNNDEFALYGFIKSQNSLKEGNR